MVSAIDVDASRSRSLLDLVPAHGGVPEFLAPEQDGRLDELLEVVKGTPTRRLAYELARANPSGTPSAWARDLAAGSSSAARDLGHAIHCWHDDVLAPLWPSLELEVAAELRRRAWQLSTRGAPRRR